MVLLDLQMISLNTLKELQQHIWYSYHTMLPMRFYCNLVVGDDRWPLQDYNRIANKI
jgi:hypothetical protein